MPSYYAILWATRIKLDDSLDVFAAHGLGGIVGALMTGVLAQAAWGGSDGLLAGNGNQLLIQLISVVATLAYSGVVSFLLLKAIGLVSPLRADTGQEGVGMDLPLHDEEAYAQGEGAILVPAPPASVVPAQPRVATAGNAGGAS